MLPSNQSGLELRRRAHHAPYQRDTREQACQLGVVIPSAISSLRASKEPNKNQQMAIYFQAVPPPAFPGKSSRAKGGHSKPVPQPRLVRADTEHQRWEKTHQRKGIRGSDASCKYLTATARMNTILGQSLTAIKPLGSSLLHLFLRRKVLGLSRPQPAASWMV